MKIKKSVQLLLFCFSVLSCGFMSCKSSSERNLVVDCMEDTVTHDDPFFERNMEVKRLEDTVCYYDTSGKKYFYAPYGKDSLLMIPDYALANLYDSPMESYRKKYTNYQNFKREFLYNPETLPDRLSWSYHIGINQEVMYDYHHMTFDDFWKKYIYVEENDTLLSINDTTLAYCLDKHKYFCIFNYMNKEKTKIIKSEYQY